MACDWTVEVDSYEKMEWISSKRVDIASYGSSVRNIFSGVFLHSAMVFGNPNRLSATSLQCAKHFLGAFKKKKNGKGWVEFRYIVFVLNVSQRIFS